MNGIILCVSYFQILFIFILFSFVCLFNTMLSTSVNVAFVRRFLSCFLKQTSKRLEICWLSLSNPRHPRAAVFHGFCSCHILQFIMCYNGEFDLTCFSHIRHLTCCASSGKHEHDPIQCAGMRMQRSHFRTHFFWALELVCAVCRRKLIHYEAENKAITA